MCDHHHLRAPTPAGEVEHVNYLSENIGALFMREDYSDVTLVVEAQKFPAHKVVLAARSEYFRALLFGGMKESTASEIELKDTNASAFKYLLKYIYTGKMMLIDLKEEIMLEVMGMAHQYVFKDLEVAISDYLKANLNSGNVCMIYDIACVYDLKSLCHKCCEYMDRNAAEIMTNESFLQLSTTALQELISRDSFCANEIDIFKAIQAWKDANPDSDISGIVSAVRLPLMSMDELLNQVRESSLVCPDALLDAIKVKNASRNMELKYRGFLCPEENVATLRHSAQVIRGEMKSSLLDGDHLNYDLDRGFTRHPIDDNHGQGVVIKLNMPYIINTIKMLLWDRDMRSYSYQIDVSMDDKDWVTVVDHSKYLCRSWQYLRFPATVVKFIRIVGTHNTVNRVFHLVSFECFYSRKTCKLENGIIVPSNNVATTDDSACVIEGVSRSRNALINGDTKNYDWDSGYTCHQLGSGAIVVQLAQPYIIDSMRLLLWDCDMRSYSYYIEVSTDQHNWRLVADKTREACRSWQTITFARQPVTFVRIVGTHNTANEVFHCVHFECPAETSAIEEYERNKNIEAVNLSTSNSAGGSSPNQRGAGSGSQDEIDVGSDPEDDAASSSLHLHRHGDLPEAHALLQLPAMVAPSPGSPPRNQQQQQPQLANPAGAANAQPQFLGGAVGGANALMPLGGGAMNFAVANQGPPPPQQEPMRLQLPLDRGDGFGLEPGEEGAEGGAGGGNERGGSPVHSD